MNSRSTSPPDVTNLIYLLLFHILKYYNLFDAREQRQKAQNRKHSFGTDKVCDVEKGGTSIPDRCDLNHFFLQAIGVASTLMDNLFIMGLLDNDRARPRRYVTYSSRVEWGRKACLTLRHGACSDCTLNV